MNYLDQSKQQKIADIAALVIEGVKCWHKAGSILVELIDDDPAVVEAIAQQAPELTPNVIRQLERIGRGQLVPELMLRSGAGWNRLRFMPVGIQQRYLNEPIELVVESENGISTLRVKVQDLTRRQAQQVFATDECIVRDASAQRAWMIDNKPTATDVEDRAPWKVCNGELAVTAPCTFTKAQLKTILSGMKGSKRMISGSASI